MGPLPLPLISGGGPLGGSAGGLVYQLHLALWHCRRGLKPLVPSLASEMWVVVKIEVPFGVP